MTFLTIALTIVVAVLALLVVGLLRSHAAILQALHAAGVNLDPDADIRDTGVAVDTAGQLVGPVPVDAPARAGSTQADSATPLRAGDAIDLRTAEGVAAPAHVSGQQAVDIAGRLPTGGVRTIALSHTNGNRVRQSTLLAFLTTGCSTCAEFWNAFNDGVDLPGGMRLVIVAKGPEEESPATVAELAPAGATTVMSSDAWDDYGVPVSPYFALVDGASGVVIGEGAAHGWDLVRQMLARAVADTDHGAADAADGSAVSRRDVLLGRQRDRHIDAELAAAGIEPGDVRLYHATPHQSGGRVQP